MARRLGSSTIVCGLVLATATPLWAATTFEPAATGGRPRWMADVEFALAAVPRPALTSGAAVRAQAAPTPRPKVIEYSEGYQTRLKIHKIASFATIPLFVAEGAIGQSLYSNPTSGKRTAHLAVATGIGVLFGINTVTGVWNLIEAKKDPNGRGRRLTHSLLMLAADGAFFATALTGPGHHYRDVAEYEGSRSLHRSLAFTSIALASAGYVIMLFGGH